jgi:hypothetical protein
MPGIHSFGVADRSTDEVSATSPAASPILRSPRRFAALSTSPLREALSPTNTYERGSQTLRSPRRSYGSFAAPKSARYRPQTRVPYESFASETLRELRSPFSGMTPRAVIKPFESSLPNMFQRLPRRPYESFASQTLRDLRGPYGPPQPYTQ